MQLSTVVELPVKKLTITHKSNLLLLGSCFSNNIGAKLVERKFVADVNPFGILYNPISIATALNRIIDGTPFDENSQELQYHQERWHSMLHHGDFSHAECSQMLLMVNNRLLSAHEGVEHCDVVMITFGTSYVYRRLSDNLVVGNCHKLPANMFSRELLSVTAIVDTMHVAIEHLLRVAPKAKVLFTVSPIRHLRDGAHDNQISKSTLLIAIDELCRHFPQSTIYFPAYEIMLDELRDYRFYADDMLHPSSLAVEYIWECFVRCFFDNATETLNRDIETINRALLHRPFDDSSKAYIGFIKDTKCKIEKIIEKNPHLDFDKEISKCNTILNR